MSDAPETLRNLGYHLRVMADKAIEQIDAERLLRAAEEVERADLPPRWNCRKSRRWWMGLRG